MPSSEWRGGDIAAGRVAHRTAAASVSRVSDTTGENKTGDGTGGWSRPTVAAGALITAEDGRVLLVKPSYKPLWEIPGGMVEAGETPARGLEREIAEELGIAVPAGPLLVADWAPLEPTGDKLLFVFDCGRLDSGQAAALRPDGVEIVDLAYHPLAALDDLLIPRLARRLRAALDARRDHTVSYLEHGVPHRAAELG
jgi:8-oxo-dGTP diphosphatase